MDLLNGFFEEKEEEKSLAHAEDFKGKIRFGSRKNSIPFNKDLCNFLSTFICLES